MAHLKEQAKWEEGIYQYEITDPLQGGEDGIDNVQGKQLANRTLYLKEALEQQKTAAKQYTDQLLIKIFENGYIQWPGMPTPDTLFTFEGYRWAEVNYDGCFFRAKGKGANPFDGAEQGDAIRDIQGSFGRIVGDGALELGSGCFSSVAYGALPWHISEMTSYIAYFKASYVVPTAEENRSRNRTFIIWKLEKI